MPKKGGKMPKEAKDKISAKLKGRVLDPDLVRRRTEKRWCNNPFWHSPEGIERIKAAASVPCSREKAQKISDTLRGRTMGIEYIGKMVWNRRGRTHSEETKEKIKYGVKRYWDNKKAGEIEADQELADNLSEVRGAIKHKKERRRIEGGDT